jgi:Phospholipase_D-nuclease N-terminal
MVLAASDYPLLNLFWTTFIIFGWILWFWLLIRVFSDLFRRPDLGGWAKAAWCVFVIVLPFIGVLSYLISQGRSMQARAMSDVQEQRAATDAYIRSVAADADATQQGKARDLLQSGAITSDEFDRMVGNSRH